MHDIWKKMVDQIFSGRWIITVSCAVVFMYCAVFGKLNPVDIKEIIMMVVVFYFTKKADNGPTKPA